MWLKKPLNVMPVNGMILKLSYKILALFLRLIGNRLLDIDQYLKNQGYLDFLSDSIPYGESNPAKKNIIIN